MNQATFQHSEDSVWVYLFTLGCYATADYSSADDTSSEPRRFLVPVESTLKNLLSREDTDQNVQITIDDFGPKV